MGQKARIALVLLFREPYALVVTKTEHKGQTLMRGLRRMVQVLQKKGVDVAWNWQETNSAIITRGGKSTQLDLVVEGELLCGSTRADGLRPSLAILDVSVCEGNAFTDEWVGGELTPAVAIDGRVERLRK